jgi:hypothetical protein
MSTQLANVTVNTNNFHELEKFADRIAKSSMVPRDYIGKPENVIVAVMMGNELGLKPFQAMQNIAVINGRPSVWGDAALALVMAHPEFEDIQEDDFETIRKNKKATCIIKRKGRTPVIRSFDFEDAKKANLIGKAGPWSQYESRMYQMRARAFAMRDSFTDVLKGVYIAEEAQDMPAEKDITPVSRTVPTNTLRAKLDKLIESKKPIEQMVEIKQSDEVVSETTEQAEQTDQAEPVIYGDLSKVLESISKADSLDDLKATQGDAEKLSDADKKTAREAYKKKGAELKSAAETVAKEFFGE